MAVEGLLVVESWPLQRDGRCVEVTVVAVLEGQPFYRGGSCTEVAVIRKGLLYKRGCCIVAVEG